MDNLGPADSLVDRSPTPEPDDNPVPLLSEPDGVLPPSRKKRAVLRDDDQKAKLAQLCCIHFKRYLAGKEKFYQDMRFLFLAAEGVDVNVKGYLYRWVQNRKNAVEMGIMKSGIARHYGGFEQAVDKWIQLTDAATEQKRRAREQKKIWSRLRVPDPQLHMLTPFTLLGKARE